MRFKRIYMLYVPEIEIEILSHKLEITGVTAVTDTEVLTKVL